MNLIEEKIRGLVERETAEEGLTLVDMSLIQRKGSAILRVYADKQGGITVGECAGLSRKLGMVIDNEEVFEGRYILEVSSPGLDRPLKTALEFGLKIGQKIRLYYSGLEGQSLQLEGMLEKAAEDMVTIVNDDGQFEIELARVAKGQILI